jgi:pilus assembly protein CpaC
MVVNQVASFYGLRLAVAAMVVAQSLTAYAQDAPSTSKPPVVQKITASNTKVEMTVNASRILTMDQAIPKAQVANPDLLDFTVLSENQVQIHAKKAGLTTINLWDDKDEVHTVDVVILGDVRELDRLLRDQFPTAAVRLTPTSSSSLLLSGYVDRTDYVNRIVTIAQEFYPKVINNMIVGGSQQVLLHVRVMEVSRTNLKSLGFDFANFSGKDFMASSASGIINKANPTAGLFRTAGSLTTNGAETIQFGIVNDPSGFVGMLEALKRENLLKVLAEPNLVTVSGRPASYLVGGEVPYPQPTGFGNISINFKPFGTQIDFVPIVLGNGGVRLEVRPQVSELDRTIGVSINGTTVPGFRERMVDTGVELKFGQTLAIAGLLQQRVEMEKRGLPYLMDVPYLGMLFSRKVSTINEVELLIVVRPELVEAMDPDQVPPCGPGANSMSPDDCDLYWRGYMEVPVKPQGQGHGPGAGHDGAMPGPEQVVPPSPTPQTEEMPRAQAPGRGGRAVVVSDAPATPRVASNGSRRGAAQPVATRSRTYNPSNPQGRKTPPAANSGASPPGFIGPIGYDVRN